MIKEHEWEAFTQQPSAPVLEVVKEFYANAIEAEGDVVQVQGKNVSFDPASISAYFCLRDLTANKYSKYRDGGNQWHKALKCLCRPGAIWETQLSAEFHIATSELSRYGLAWFSFICSRLLPTTKVTEVNKDRASLLYAIVKGKKIDVGLIIYNSIRKALRGDFATPVTDSLPFYGSSSGWI